MRLSVPAGLAAALMAVPAMAARDYPGPVPADVVSVYDGDSFTALAHPWPGLDVTVRIRVKGVDTPEIRGKCESEKEAARAARNRVRELVKGGVLLARISDDKYSRKAARVFLPDGRDLAEILVTEGYGRRYDGGRREGWCD